MGQSSLHGHYLTRSETTGQGPSCDKQQGVLPSSPTCNRASLLQYHTLGIPRERWCRKGA